MALDWYPWFVVDYRRDTRHLTLAEHGAYRALIDEYMTSRGPLPDNDRALATIIGCGLNDWLAVAAAVRPFFEVSTKKLIHDRCERELKVQQSYSNARAQAGRKGGFAKANKYNGMLAELQPSHVQAIAKRSTLQDTNIISSEFCSAGPLATALPTGALREPANGGEQIKVSESLRRSMKQKGWVAG